MTELKTLKDLYENTTDKEIVMVKDLRDEAIKWIKKGYYDDLGIIWDSEIDKWIKHFFNLTEENLK